MFTHYIIDYPSVQDNQVLVGLKGIMFPYKMTLFHDEDLGVIPDGEFTLVKLNGTRHYDRITQMLAYLMNLLSINTKTDRFLIISNDDTFKTVIVEFKKENALVDIQVFPDLLSQLHDDFLEIDLLSTSYFPKAITTFRLDNPTTNGYIN